MNIVLFLLVLDYGWVKVGDTYEDLEACQVTQDTFIEGHPDIIEGFCCHLTCEGCDKVAVVRESSLFYCASCWFKNFTNRKKANGK